LEHKVLAFDENAQINFLYIKRLISDCLLSRLGLIVSLDQYFILFVGSEVFRKELIVEAHHWGKVQGIAATDDAMLVEQMGQPVFLLEGEPTNIKITVPEDFLLAEALLREGRAG
jgi:hypothetical protein